MTRPDQQLVPGRHLMPWSGLFFFSFSYDPQCSQGIVDIVMT